MAARALLVLAALATVCSGVREVRQVPHFTGIHANGGIEVHVNVSTDGSSSLTLEAPSESLSRVRSAVDGWGTLILLKEGGAAVVVAEVTVPGPLSYVGATSRSSVLAGAVAGAMLASRRSRIVADTLESSRDVAIAVSAQSSVELSGGKVPGLSVSSSSESSASLSGLHAARATLTASSKSSISGVTVGTATATASDNSNLAFSATGSVGLSCTSSEVRIDGTGRVTTWSDWNCQLHLPNPAGAAGAVSAAPVYP